MNTKSRSSTIATKRLVGYSMYAVAIIMPLSNLPQIIQLYSTQTAAGLSLQTWVIYMAFGFVPLAYGLVYKVRPMVISNILWTAVDVIMIYGIVRFGYLAGPQEYERLVFLNQLGKGLAGFAFLCASSALALFAYDLLEEVKRAKK
jgi:uncharacterized protein with PQ loop repeat